MPVLRKAVAGFVCGTAFLYELNTKGKARGVEIYDSIKALRKACNCCRKGCGIVEISMKLVKWHIKHDEVKMVATARKLARSVKMKK